MVFCIDTTDVTFSFPSSAFIDLPLLENYIVEYGQSLVPSLLNGACFFEIRRKTVLEQSQYQGWKKTFIVRKTKNFYKLTSRERPKSAPYLRLKNSKRTSMGQVFSSTVPA